VRPHPSRRGSGRAGHGQAVERGRHDPSPARRAQALFGGRAQARNRCHNVAGRAFADDTGWSEWVRRSGWAEVAL